MSRPFASIYKGQVEINCTCGHEYIFEFPQVEEEYSDNWVVMERVHEDRTFYSVCPQCESGHEITMNMKYFCSVGDL